MASDLSRRSFLRTSMLLTAGFAGLRTFVNRPLAAAELAAGGTASAGFGPLTPDPLGIFELPKGFSYHVFSKLGETMDDGFRVPGKHDGMAAFPGPDGLTLLVRNHELESEWIKDSPFGPGNELFSRIDPAKVYDSGKGVRPNLGGTTTLVYDTRTRELKRHYLSLVGTVRNCAGGPTPWGTWVTCEEVNDEPEPNAEKPHGYNFEVRPSAEIGLADPVPLKAMGRFRHEAIAVDTRSGVIYETEDTGNGLFYRFLPAEKGNLAAGGRLQALALVGADKADTRNWPGTAAFPQGKRVAVRWIDMDDVESPKGDLRERGYAKGAALFARAEGAWEGNDSIYFACTNGGPKLLGQIFRYHPSAFEGTEREAEAPGELELFVESSDNAILSNCDTLCVAPWGDLVVCEDTSGPCRLIGITPQGECYVIARNTRTGRELAGACFSPDGSTLFVNIQTPGQTFAITGPWPRSPQA
jgi:uncharacterized protein